MNFTFEGHKIVRHRGVRVLNHEELQNGDVSLEYVSRLMQRRYTDAPTIRKVLQTMWYQVNSGQEIWVIGTILDDKTVRGGTGWGAEFAKLCNKKLHVFDQDKKSWFWWNGDDWHKPDQPATARASCTPISRAPAPGNFRNPPKKRSKTFSRGHFCKDPLQRRT